MTSNLRTKYASFLLKVIIFPAALRNSLKISLLKKPIHSKVKKLSLSKLSDSLISIIRALLNLLNLQRPFKKSESKSLEPMFVLLSYVIIIIPSNSENSLITMMLIKMDHLIIKNLPQWFLAMLPLPLGLPSLCTFTQ